MDNCEIMTKKVAVIAGGWSEERDRTMQSGRGCVQARCQARFARVDLYDVAESSFVEKLIHGGFEVAFITMHGRYGEDGCIQGLLEILHIPYTFSGVLASAAATEKEVAKAFYQTAHIPVAAGVDIGADTRLTEDQTTKIVEKLGLPLFVKPAANGSSFGVTRVSTTAELADAISLAGREGGRVLIEECVVGTEITVPVIGNEDPRALPIVEIVPGADFYDQKVKYEPSSQHHVIPARLEPAVYAKAQSLAVRAHKVLGCRGASRSDFIVRNDGTPVILETNTIPGMTATSLLPDSAAHGGIDFPSLCRMLIEYALDEHAKRSR